MAAVQIFYVIVNFALQTLITPAYVIALVLFYYDQRVRGEGYDIEWMMEQAGLTVPEAVAAPDDSVQAALVPEAGPVKEL